MLEDKISDLPNHLWERTRLVRNRNSDGRLIVYWMRNAIRADENPALDVARLLADRLDLPLLVYQGLSEHYRYASDRHHTFIMQGAREIHRELCERGISYAFHLASELDRRPHLLSLADVAAIVVTEEMPVDPARRFLKVLFDRTETAILCVDTACVVPMQLIGKPYTRAFQYRNATKKLYAERLQRQWPELERQTRPVNTRTLPFVPIDLPSADIAGLVSQCEIDHSVGPVADSTGGSTAGYERWNRFKQDGLGSYAKLRNNALTNGVSRMSPYLHYGMVSPLRIAREAAEIDNRGSKKFLDELLIWRELAYNFCFHRSDHDQWSAIPDWARESLESHAEDRREHFYTWEQLARGETHDRLWNAAQKSLLMQGELHNNVRMTWGKAILKWTEHPEQALKLMIDLNHRYALDGRDPASYGGILWCLGQFDRPFEPPQPILGTVRSRPSDVHAARLNVEAYYLKVTTPRFELVPHVAVIGAGMSGLFAARTLVDHGLQVTVFEKSRGVGGRMATRRTGHSSFDHGAQYFTARDPRFHRYVQSWLRQGLVGRWPDTSLGVHQRIVVLKDGQIVSQSNSTERFVGVPAMNAICKHLARGFQIRKQTHIAEMESIDNRIVLATDDHSLGSFDRLIISAPAAQSAKLLANFPVLADPVSKIQINPCWAAMITLDQPVTDRWVGAFVHDSFLTWVARNSTKPGRPGVPEHLVIHAGDQWTSQNWERDSAAIASEMLDEFWRVSGLQPQNPVDLQAHRWKYAIPVDPPQTRCLFDAKTGIAVCGDWLSAARIEGALLSGMAAAGRILGTLAPV